MYFLFFFQTDEAENESNADERELDENEVRLDELLDDMGLEDEEEDDEPEPDIDNGDGLPLEALGVCDNETEEGSGKMGKGSGAPTTVFDVGNFKPSEMKFL